MLQKMRYLQNLESLVKYFQEATRGSVQFDAVFVSNSQSELRRLVDELAESCPRFELTINRTNTKVLMQGESSEPLKSIEQHTSKTVHSFTYLGRTVTNTFILSY